jgi:hypothetical protein
VIDDACMRSVYVARRAASEISPHPRSVEPANLVESRPQFRGLVDVNLASLLRVRLAELFARPQAL